MHLNMFFISSFAKQIMFLRENKEKHCAFSDCGHLKLISTLDNQKHSIANACSSNVFATLTVEDTKCTGSLYDAEYAVACLCSLLY